MHLVTLEGLQGSCVELLKTVHGAKKIAVIPLHSPVPPAATSHFDVADELRHVLANVLQRAHMMSRVQRPPIAHSGTHIVIGSHWVDTSPPALSMTARVVLHQLCLDLTAALVEDLRLDIESHIMIFLKQNVHECFETLLLNMEARDITITDLEDSARFLDLIAQGYIQASAFKHVMQHIEYPPFMNDNVIDLSSTAAKIINVITQLHA